MQLFKRVLNLCLTSKLWIPEVPSDNDSQGTASDFSDFTHTWQCNQSVPVVVRFSFVATFHISLDIHVACCVRNPLISFLKHSAPERSLKSLQNMSVSFLGCIAVKRVSGVLDCAARHPYQTSHLHTKEARSFAEDPWTTTCEEGSCEWEMIVFQ